MRTRLSSASWFVAARDVATNPRVMRTELLAGLVVALALIPEAIAFSLIAGVDPKVGLYASFTMAVAIAFTGGRPAMISAATGAMALLIVPLVRDHGLEYLLAATILAGVIQVSLGLLGIARLMRFIPRSVMTGFVNALAILIFLSQMPYLTGVPWTVYVLVGAGLAIMFLLPRLTTVVPAPLVAIVVLTLVAVGFGLGIPDVGDQGALPDTIPVLGIPSVPLSFETLLIILPFSISLAAVGLLESLLTAQLVDDITYTRSNKAREARGQGIANVITGFFGGMAGCAMIGQTMINVKVSGARTRLSTFAAGMLVLALVVGLGNLVSIIPMAALVSVMVLVAVSTFNWHSIAPSTLRRMPRSETIVMLTTVAITVFTDNLALGVGAGVIVAMVFFARRVAHLVDVSSSLSDDGATKTYVVTGEIFFASDRDLVDAFDYINDPENVVIDLRRAHIWDAAAVAALDAIEMRYADRERETDLDIFGLNARSERLHLHLSGKMGSAA